MLDSNSEMSKPDRPEVPEELQRKADLIIRDFRRLAEQYIHPWPINIAKKDISIEHLRSKKDLLTGLDSRLLPRLQKQCVSLASLLHDPSHLREDPTLTLNLISETQTNLHLILCLLHSNLEEIFPENPPSPCQKNDQHFREFKAYRLYQFDRSIRKGLKDGLQKLYQESIQIIEEFKLSTKNHTNFVQEASYSVNESIDIAIGWSKGPDLNFVWDIWQDTIVEFDSDLQELMIQMSLEKISDGNPEDPLSQPTIEFARSLIPIIKLTRVFFTKLFREESRKEKAEFFTTLCSDQLNSLNTSIDVISDYIFALPIYIKNAHKFPRIVTTSGIIEGLNKAVSHFLSYFSIVKIDILPNLFPKPEDLLPQIQLQQWFDTWYELFHDAFHIVHHAADSFDQISSSF
ncbi:hypothetical protein PGT21_014826 [Puccinia graminis f. sp. tritici]|uniref:Uncharacterized protein n=1 Tax=Puccinia graminis f. sp. tritici TaxID=56615 RepID=A0A5B0M9Q8_PUCGR|nr:hypothetical protein PGT21_014826 [Puccinia graminis f. sp. tritici]